MTVLITGLGYLGVPLALELLGRGERVVGIENFFSTPPECVVPLTSQPRFRLVQASVSSARAVRRVFREEEISTVFHLAAQASAHPRAAPASYTEQANLVGPRVLLESIPPSSHPTVILGSSFRVYGDALRGHVSETQPYGIMADLSHLSKIYTEKLLELYAHQRQLSAVALRLGVVYGLGPCMKRDPRFMTVPNLFCFKAARGETLEVHPGAARPVGFIHLRDAVRALAESPRLAKQGFRAVNAATEVHAVPEVAELVRAQARERGVDVRVSSPARGQSTSFSVESSLAEIGFLGRERMERSLGEMLDDFAATQSAPAHLAAGALA